MSSDKTPVIKRTRSSGNSTSSQTQRSRSSISNEPQSPIETLLMPGADVDEPQQEGISGPVLPPMHDTEVLGTDTASLDPTSIKEGVLPRTTDQEEEGRDKLDTGSRRSIAEEIPQDNTKTDKLAGNDTEDAAKEAPTPSKPTLEKSWEVIMTEVTSLDEGLVAGWKEDIDTLLVFAGLFSAVVTAFTIESYQWLQEAPEDTTVALLRQISQQLNGTSIPEPDTFAVSSSDVAINVLWFLSLITALVDALFALLCKQWLREHRRDTHTRTPAEALALRWLRNQGLEKWPVPTILASLPILLELALFLFLAGLLELLRMRHPVLFSIATIVVAFAAVFYLGTTIIPAVDIARQALQVTKELGFRRNHPKSFGPSFCIMRLPPLEYICPYKSPQAWAAFQSFRLFSRILGPLDHAAQFLWRRGYIASFDHLIGHLVPTSAFGQIISNLSNWSSVDLELLRRADIELAPPFYELNAFRWLVAELRDSPHMIPHLRNILSTIPLHLVMPVVFDQWFFLPGRKWTIGDIETALAPNRLWRGIDSHLTLAKERFLSEGRETQLFNSLLHWIHVSVNGGDKRMDGGQDSPDIFAPFRSIDANPNARLRARLWDIYMQIAQDPAASDYHWVTLMEDLAPYIIASSPDYALHLPTATTTSLFVKSADGCEFLSEIHSTILERKIFETGIFDIGMDWMEAMDIVQRVHNFPENHFKPIPGHFSPPLTKLKKTLNSLSPTDPGGDFQYLDEFRRGWGNADERNKSELVKILSNHLIWHGVISYPSSDAEPSYGPGKISPIVMSPAGLELMTFVNDRLAEEPETRIHLPGFYRPEWRNAIRRVREAHPELPPDHFKDLVHEGFELPPPREPPSQQEVEAEPQAGDPGRGPGDVTVDHDDEMNGRSHSAAAELFSQPEPGELDPRGPLVEGGMNEQGNMSRQPVVTGDPVTASDSSAVQGEKMVGHPDADKNV
ncbi:hypothetical protein PQX77_001083 [Marasmius sp. AFHP31]|nr:hypothetical protein PQX77_001083 [Marasmius sp. AFHP31]